ncbi:hypothetical protein DV735_g5215, partial [Chaetothyriales sp. CBS 134920]
MVLQTRRGRPHHQDAAKQAFPTSKAQPNEANYDPYTLPDFETEFVQDEDLQAFAEALAAPTAPPVTALNDWRPIYQKIKKVRRRRTPGRSKDETREGWVYAVLYWPLLLIVMGWIVVLLIAYNLTRLYIYGYEHLRLWGGKQQTLKQRLGQAKSYAEWAQTAQELDEYLGNEKWKRSAPYSYYNYQTVKKVKDQLAGLLDKSDQSAAVEELKVVLEGCVRNNFVGVESPQLYSETYIGSKDLVQQFVETVEQGLRVVLETKLLSREDKAAFFKHLELNYGRTALCLSGGATFAYYHFGVIRALLEAKDLPSIVTGTSGGALVAALVATRTDAELKQLLVPALAHRITACHESFPQWTRRWWRTGARFDSVDWARRCSWFCRGSLTFREAYERTGRVLNVSCVPSDPHSPVLLNNHITSPDCVIWSAVLASAAVPGILNPIVLMRKTKDGKLVPYSFGNKWKDGSLRTDIPLKSLNIHFNVNFSIVSQVNPHINLFFFSPRGSPGRPVSHRKGRGWRGGFLGSSLETSIKLDLQKNLKILRHLELLPRLLGHDWSEIWLQRFSGTITIWPKTKLSDFWNILSDPSPKRLDRMLRAGELRCWPKIRFVDNRMRVEKLILEGIRRSTTLGPRSTVTTASTTTTRGRPSTQSQAREQQIKGAQLARASADEDGATTEDDEDDYDEHHNPQLMIRRPSTVLEEISRQASVLWHDDDLSEPEDSVTTEEESYEVVDVDQNGERKH